MFFFFYYWLQPKQLLYEIAKYNDSKTLKEKLLINMLIDITVTSYKLEQICKKIISKYDDIKTKFTCNNEWAACSQLLLTV